MNTNTPLMRQYHRIKSQYTQHILFFRLGDFYEMFDTDAVEASRILGLTLTARNGIKMCGIPYHVAASYLEKLIHAGKKIAICEQITSSNNKDLMERAVTEILTPGTYTEIDRLNPSKNNFLLSFYCAPGMIAAAWIDISTGEFTVHSQKSADSFAQLSTLLERFHPREVILQESLLHAEPRVISRCKELHILVNSHPDWMFEKEKGFERACRHFGLVSLKAFEIEERSIVLAPIAVLFDYFDANFHKSLQHIQRISTEHSKEFLHLNEAAQKSLELLQSQSSSDTLFSTLNHCKTAMGERLLRRWILAPLNIKSHIDKRLECVGSFYAHQQKLSELRQLLEGVSDVERLSSRIGMLKAHPKDIVALSHSLSLALQALAPLQDECAMLEVAYEERTLTEMIARIDRALLPNAPLQYHEGGIIADAYDEELDRLRGTLKDYESNLQQYLSREKTDSKIPFLRLRTNKVLGVFFEIPKSKLTQVPSHFILRQSVSSGNRYSTAELIRMEEQRMQAEEKLYGYEQELFISFRNTLLEYLPATLSIARTLAIIDLLHSFAWVATLNHYKAPRICKDPILQIRGGRHPVVEQTIHGENFIPNDLSLSADEQLFSVITGPNMAGKSTYLRQTALIVIMAQMGSFVPAEEARIGLVDKIFCRVGASDNISRGESTFLVEMTETSVILNASTDRSLLIMDEVGRGTSTLDGLALAWAISEHILQHIKARTLFATHYHELAALDHPLLSVFCIRATKTDDTIKFSHKLEAGLADASYGIDVARLAGIPSSVVRRARALLEQLSVEHQSISMPKDRDPQQELFSTETVLTHEISHLDINTLTPLEALTLLAKLKLQVDKES